MANGNRDVSLVIRAKNEASRTLDTISASLAELRKSQGSVSESGKKTGNVLSQLGTELGKLRQQVGGANTLERLAGSMEKAATAVASLEAATAKTRQEQAGLQAELQKTEGTATRLSQRQQQLSDRLAHQQGVTDKSKQTFAELTAEIQRGEAAIARSGQQTQKFVDRLSRQEGALEKTRTQYRQLAQQISVVEQPSNRLLDQFEKTEARLAKQQNTLQRTQTEYREYLQTVDQTAASLPRLRRSQEQAAASFEQAASSQDRTARALGHVSEATRRVETQTRQAQGAIERNASAYDKQSSSLAKARTEFGQVEQAAEQANLSLEKIGSTVRQRLLRSLQDSKQQLAEYRQEWQATQQAIRSSVQGGGNVADPSPELGRQLELARQQKRAYEETRIAVHQYRQAIREAGTDVGKLATAQQAYEASLGRIAQQTQKTTAATKQKSQAHRQDTQAVRENEAAMAALERRGRAAMTWAQRLRGEVIALTLSYLGLYAAIEQLRGVTNAFMELEAANNRMLVAFNGNEAISGREMRWVREEADRLGIQFGILAQEYSKFAIANRGSNLEGAETRRIFEAVTVAARVNKLTIDQMQGTFLALSQMSSKGVVSMEELRRQMGDRLYGAFTLAAEGMGITTAELDKLVSSGSLFTDEFLPKFANRLEEVFGPQLSQSLDTFTTDLGRFQNELFKTQLRVAEAGFISGLREALNSLSEFFKSDEGTRFFETLGAAAGGLVRILAEIPQHFELILFVLAALSGVRIVAWLGLLQQRFTQALAAARPLPATLNATTAAANGTATGMTNASRAAALATTSFTRIQGSMRGAAAMLTTVQGRAVALTRVMTGLRAGMAMLGGIPGIIITGVSLALTAWATRSRDVVDVTQRHEDQMQRLLDEYSRIAQAAGDWGKALEEGINGVSLDVAEKNFADLVEKFEADLADAAWATSGRIESSIAIVGEQGLDEYARQVVVLSRELKAGERTASSFRQAIAAILRNDNVPQRLREIIRDASDVNDTFVSTEEKLLEAAAAVAELGGDLEGLPPILQALVPTLQDLAEAAGLIDEETVVDPYIALNKQLEALRGKVPSLTDEMKLMENLSAIDQILDTASAIEGIDKTSDAFQNFLNLVRQAKGEIQDAFDARRFQAAAQALNVPGGSGGDLSASLIRQREGFRETPYWDKNAYRVGFGSDTITLADGSIRQVVQGMRVSVVDANRDLLRRIDEFQGTVRRQVGESTWQGLNPQQQAVLTSNAYNYGSLTDSLREAVRSGSTEAVQEALRNQASHNGGENAERRQQEAYLYGQAGAINAEANQRFAEEQLRLYEQQVERAGEYNDQLDRTLSRRAEDLQYVDGISREMAIARALEDERLSAARAGVELSAEQLAMIQRNAAAAWDQKAAEDAVRKAKEAQSEADARINTLMQHRSDLMEQITFHESQGDNEAVQQLKEQLNGVTEDVRGAIDAMIVFWEAARGGENGEEVDAAIARLQTLRNSLVETKTQMDLLSESNLGQTFGQHMVGGLNNLLAKIRETGDVIGSLKDAFLQFASDFLLKIAQMIAQQMLFNALSTAFGGAGGGGFWGGVIQGVSASVNHDGGVIGSTSRSRTVSPGLFAGAMRYHGGGIAGLKPNEVPAILEEGEEVLTASDPRHRANGSTGGGNSNPQSIKIVNAIDSASVVEAGLSTRQGEKAILNFIQANRSSIKNTLG